MTATRISRLPRRPAGSCVRRAEFTPLSRQHLGSLRERFRCTKFATPTAGSLTVAAILALITVPACSPPRQAPEDSAGKPPATIPAPSPTRPTPPEDPPDPPAPQAPPVAERPLRERLAEEISKLRQTQQRRQELIRDFRVELAQLTADLQRELRSLGWETDEALKQLAQAPATGPLANLSAVYQKCVGRQVNIQRLKDAIDNDHPRLAKLELADDNLRQQARLEGVVNSPQQDAVQHILGELDREKASTEQEILQNPALALELEGAAEHVMRALRQRSSLAPTRTEKSLDQLPPLPSLDFSADGLSQRNLLDAMREHLDAGQAEAKRLLTASQPESALIAVQTSLTNARNELEKYAPPPSWKSDCTQQFDRAQYALSEQLAGPYLTAIETAVPQARKNQDWSPILDLLEDVLRLTPRGAAKLPELVREIDVLLQWRENVGDADAAVARKRFQAIREQVERLPPPPPPPLPPPPPPKPKTEPKTEPEAEPKPEVKLKVHPKTVYVIPPGTSDLAPKELDFQAWERGLKALHLASRRYLELEAELKTILVDYQATAPKAQQKQAELDEQRKVVEAKLAEQDRAEQDVFGQYARLIAKRQQAYEHLTKTLGMKTTAPEPVQVERQIAGLRAEQQPYAAGNERASGRGPAVDVVAVARRVGFAGLKADDPFVLSYQGVAIPLRWCPPGSFRMGSAAGEPGRSKNEGQVEVTLSTGFWMAETETTQQLWQTVMGSTLRQQASSAGSSSALCGEGPTHPMYYVNHDEATAFCRKLNDHFRQAGTLPDDWQITLPTEAQWEYACRAGSTTAYCFGGDQGKLNQYAWFDKNSGGTTHPVSQKEPNAWKLRDMHGNLWEWCADRYGDSYGKSPVVDPTGPVAGSSRGLRGGAWFSGGSYCRSACRSSYVPPYRYSSIGFRLVVSVFRSHPQ